MFKFEKYTIKICNVIKKMIDMKYKYVQWVNERTFELHRKIITDKEKISFDISIGKSKYYLPDNYFNLSVLLCI